MEATNTYTKPGFDARIQYYEHLKEWLNAIARATITNNFYDMYIALSNTFALMQPYMRQEKADALKKMLTELERKTMDSITRPVGRKGMTAQGFGLHQQFLKFKEELYIAGKHMLLPVKEEEEKEWKDSDFIDGSSI
jgi:hypothetical protein